MLVVVVGALVARQLSAGAGEHHQAAVGVMLTSFGLFWVGEGAGVHWPGSDLAIVVIIGIFALFTLGLVTWLRRVGPRSGLAAPGVAVERRAE